MHRLLARQLKKHIGSSEDVPQLVDFVKSVNDAYIAFEDDRTLLEHSSEVSSNELQNSLEKVKEMKEQMLIQDKMASLGGLAAGIAHEIKNPLNFVNNFADLSVQLLDELVDLVSNPEEQKKDELKEVIDLLNDNLSKIVFHGKRADSIVKGMLLHSRGKSGEKTLTNLNEILDEYLNLSYHGMRAKDGSFNIELLTDFNNSIPQILMVQQDMSRVFVNLFNNSFQATQKKSSIIDSQYKPYIKVKSDFTNSMAIVTIEDNGIGIPSSISNNIFNPFFTTKDPNEGTGLGLSITYEIVVEGHEGTINFESKEGLGTKFIVKLPLETV